MKNYRHTLKKRLYKDCYGNVVIFQKDKCAYSIIYGGYGLQVCSKINSDCVVLTGNKGWYLENTLQIPAYIHNELNKIAKEFNNFEELKQFIHEFYF